MALYERPHASGQVQSGYRFRFFAKLGAPFYCFHDRDVAPEGATPQESVNALRSMVDVLGAKQEVTGVRLLWGTANLDGAREGAVFIRDHIIRVADRPLDDFAGSAVDTKANRKMLGIK